MSVSNGNQIRILKQQPLVWLLFALLLMLAFAGVSQAQGLVDGFLQPFRSVELSSDESGAILEMHVEEGSPVQKNAVIAKLDDRIQELQLELAEHEMNSHSELDAAKRSFKKREMVAQRISELRKDGHASESEIIRSEMELSISRAKYLAAQEAAISKEINYRRAKMIAERRLIRAPFDGVVSIIHRKEGEFVSPLRPEIVTLVQVDQLLAIFNVPTGKSYDFKVGKKIKIKFDDGRTATGTIHSVGVEIDAESGTLPIKIKIDNREGMFKSGERCQLEL